MVGNEITNFLFLSKSSTGLSRNASSVPGTSSTTDKVHGVLAHTHSIASARAISFVDWVGGGDGVDGKRRKAPTFYFPLEFYTAALAAQTTTTMTTTTTTNARYYLFRPESTSSLSSLLRLRLSPFFLHLFPFYYFTSPFYSPFFLPSYPLSLFPSTLSRRHTAARLFASPVDYYYPRQARRIYYLFSTPLVLVYRPLALPSSPVCLSVSFFPTTTNSAVSPRPFSPRSFPP